MAYEFYKAYINSMAKTPQEDWEESYQEASNDFWENTSTATIINGQDSISSLTYNEEEVQLNSLINIATGENFGDQYRKIIYKTYSEQLGWLGKYYIIDSKKWLLTNTNTRIGSVKSAVLRKCNNILKWYDSNGLLKEYECVYSKRLNGTNLDYGAEGVPQIDADGQILVQRNSNTNAIKYNQRFLFDGHAFQVKQIDNHYSDTLMTIYIFETQLQTNDDIVNNIASGSGEVTPITNQNKILPNVYKILLNETVNYNVYNYINGIANSNTFSIVASGANPSSYTLTIVDGNHFNIKNLLQSSIPLTITCTNNSTSEVVSIEIILGGIW